MQRFLSIALLGSLFGMPLVHGAVTSKSKALIVLGPQDLPPVVRQEGQSLKLHFLPDGRTFLYLEQQQLKRVVVLDISDPAKIKAVATVEMDLPAVFDFDGDLGDRAVLVRFRDGKGIAVMDLLNPRRPKLTSADPLLRADGTGFLRVNQTVMHGAPAAQDYQVIDSSDPLKPRLLTTVAGVRRRVTNSSTGTTYLLGASGLTVVRQPEVEWQARIASGN